MATVTTQASSGPEQRDREIQRLRMDYEYANEELRAATAATNSAARQVVSAYEVKDDVRDDDGEPVVLDPDSRRVLAEQKMKGPMTEWGLAFSWEIAAGKAVEALGKLLMELEGKR